LADKLSQKKITFGCCKEAFIRATNITSLGKDGMSFSLHIGNDSKHITINAIGHHNVSNCLAAAAMAHLLGINIDEIATGLSTFTPYDKRSNIEELESGIMVLNDCYNANPASMRAALSSLKDLKKDRCAVAVLGDMLELGPRSATAHRTLGKTVSELGIDFLAAFGNQAENLLTGALNGGMDQETARGFDSKKDIADWLLQLMQKKIISAGDWVLIKGSRGMRMEEVLELLRKNQNTI
jgi:UDP-N-acetylmuramyl pentapeptide synthase